ncbi:MAG TPA: aldo/keto reductase [Terriglobales bacterium]|nr:aldo/keto reductase [Terriglobales bacterium]
MKYRPLGRTGLEVSEIGYGAWGIGQSEWVGADDALSLKALKAARDSGINFLDTALAYGMGHSEQLLARAFGQSDEVIIASKVPPKNFIWPAQPGVPLRDVFPTEYVLSSLDRTLKNLGRGFVDLYQFHVWNDEWAANDEWLSTVREIRRSGKARFLGISINDHQPANSLRALATGLLDTVQVIYNLFDQSPEDELFPYCQQHHIGVLARVPFDEGSLTGKIRPDTTFPEGDFRHQYFGGDRKRQVWERVQRLVHDAGIPVDDLPQFALRFCLGHPAVSTVIPGMRTPAHVAANAAASDAGALSPALLARIRPHRWVRNFYD